MQKRTTERTPKERRARRIRAAFLVCFAVFAVLTLFAMAWVGSVLQRRNPPLTLVPDQAPDASACFHVAGMVESAALLSYAENKPTADFLIDQFHSFGAPLAEHGQIFFWRRDDGTAAWLAFIPIQRRNAIFVEQVRQGFQASKIILTVGATPFEETVAWYQADGRGLFLTSEQELPAYTLKQERLDCPGDFRITSQGWLPGWLISHFPEGLHATMLEAQNLELRWENPPDADSEGRILVTMAGADGESEEQTLPWFHPLIRNGLDE